MILDKVYWTMPGKVSMLPYSHMGRPVRANLGLSLGMEQIKELSPNCVNNFLRWEIFGFFLLSFPQNERKMS